MLSFPQYLSKFVFPSSMVINLWECRGLQREMSRFHSFLASWLTTKALFIFWTIGQCSNILIGLLWSRFTGMVSGGGLIQFVLMYSLRGKIIKKRLNPLIIHSYILDEALNIALAKNLLSCRITDSFMEW